ncbi:TonB-dependent receptor plug domain-containing protein [Novosphingobium rosa]|uniref:TonB-dependent receptor plug domain-containing protein n=1 Tax=Novosphingobium rosa TaxID=76978 RepID=UPI00082B50B1|nr:TonB-dependent receptor [Novosphingobium rosa]
MNIKMMSGILLSGAAQFAALPVMAQAAQGSDAAAPQAAGQAAPEAKGSADIVVTGSSIRGVAPTGSPITNLSRTEMEKTGASTVTELLRSVPSVGAFGSSGNNNGQNQANFVDQPAIHGIGVGNGGGGLTLVLLDGLRLPGAGINQTAPDPSAVPQSAIERVEVVADGASSVYGSDAVAGVINFRLRKKIEGFEAGGRTGFGDNYRTYNAHAALGKNWSTGGFYAVYEYSSNTNVNGTNRSWYQPVSNSTLCSPANVTVGGATYALSATGARLGTNSCDLNKNEDLYPEQHRHQGLIYFHQELGDGIELHARSLYSARAITNKVAISGNNAANGGLAVTVNSGAYYNYVQGLGVPAGTQTVTYNGTNDFGPTVNNRITTDTWSSNVGIEAKLFSDWKGSVDFNYGREIDNTYQPGINQTLLQQAVTAGTFNPYGVGAANSQDLINQIGNYVSHYRGKQQVTEGLIKADGSMFNLGGGAAKAAVGFDVKHDSFDARYGLGPWGSPYTTNSLGERTAVSGFAELFFPFFSAQNARGGIQKLDVVVSGRYDHYSDVGGTFNPKVGANWDPIRGVTLRGSFGTSFHAPSLADSGTAIDTRAIRFADFTGSSNPGAYSIVLAGGNKLKPETARTLSFGADIKPVAVPGLKLSLTYFNIDYKNVISFPSFSPVTDSNPVWNVYRTYNPTAAQVTAATAGMRHDGLVYPDVTTLPTAIYDLRRQNFARQKIGGIDYDLSYAFSLGQNNLNVGIAGSWLLRFDQLIYAAGTNYDRLGTAYAPKLKTRAHVNWANGPYDVAVFGNYTAGYTNTNYQNQKVASNTTFDLHAGWKLDGEGLAKDTRLALDVTNIFNKAPPLFYNALSGQTYATFDNTNASALGRVVSLALNKQF